MSHSSSLRIRALILALAFAPLVACGGGTGGPAGSEDSGTAPPPTGKHDSMLVRVDAGSDLDAVRAEVEAGDWDLVRTYPIPSSPLDSGGTLCVFESRGSAAVHDDDCEGVAKSSGASSSEKVQRMHCRRFGADQSYVPIFDDDVNFLTYAGQSSLQTIGALDSRLANAGAGVRVAVLDGAFDLAHEALAGRIAAGGYDAIDDDDDANDHGNDVDDDGDGVVDGLLGHGTAVAALVLAVAPKARVVPIRVLDDEGYGTTLTIATGILAAIDAGVKVINVSASADKSSTICSDLIALARSKGILLVASAGNGGDNQVGYPASLGDAVALGGATSGIYDEGADHGPEVDVSAPIRDLLAPYPGTTNGYGRWSGTSMSSALYSGAVAAGISLNLNSTSFSVNDTLLSKATPYVTIPNDLTNKVGKGILNLKSLLP